MQESEFKTLLQSKNNITPLIEKALAQSYKSHTSQKRFDGNTVYEGHILPVAREVIKSYEDQPVSEIAIAGALLHDTVEDDSNYSEAQLRKDFPKEVADIVMSLTKPPKDNEHEVWGEDFLLPRKKYLNVLQQHRKKRELLN
jgi:(p)ppGpp synthase/HD superfamily hydrolase